MRTALTTCPFCACGCAVYLQAEDGRPIGVAPSDNHPVAQGRLCARGWGAHEAPAWGERLTQPMIRRGGALEPASWDEALDFAAERMSSARSSDRGIGVLGSARATNEENYLAVRLARGALGTGNLDFSMHTVFRPLIDGVESVIGECPGNPSLADLERADFIMLWEGDLARTHPRAALSIMRAVKRGAKVVTFGPVKTQMSHFAALHVAVAPGREGEVIDGLLSAVIGSRLVDQRAVEERCEGYEAVRERVAAVKGATEVLQAGEWYAAAARAALIISPSVGEGAQALKDIAALASLAAITGHLGRPGSVFMPLPGRSNMRGACDMGIGPDVLPGRRRLDDQDAVRRLEGAWGKQVARERGLDAEQMIKSVGCLVVVADDPPSCLPAGSAAREAMEAMGCLIVLEAFATPTAQAAHVVLPVASPAESDGTYTSMEGRVQRVRPCTEPPGEARQGWRVLADLAARVGLSGKHESCAQVMREIAQVVPAYAEMNYEAMDKGWGQSVVAAANGRKASLTAAEPGRHASEDYPQLLAVDGVFDWGSDPLVSYGPTLSRDHAARRKLFPGGTIEMSRQDADKLGVRQGWPVKITSAHGEAVMPASLRADLQPGVLLIPFAFRDHAAAVLGGRRTAAVRSERT